jgi:hypothetical protein
MKPRGTGPVITFDDCPMTGDEDKTCPVCGATLSGDDPVNGVCQIAGFIGRPLMAYITRHAPGAKVTVDAEAFSTVIAALISVVSCYEKYGRRIGVRGPVDPFFSTRIEDMRRAAEVAHRLAREAAPT